MTPKVEKKKLILIRSLSPLFPFPHPAEISLQSALCGSCQDLQPLQLSRVDEELLIPAAPAPALSLAGDPGGPRSSADPWHAQCPAFSPPGLHGGLLGGPASQKALPARDGRREKFVFRVGLTREGLEPTPRRKQPHHARPQDSARRS